MHTRLWLTLSVLLATLQFTASSRAQIDNVGADNQVPLVPTPPAMPSADRVAAEQLPDVRLTPPVTAVEGLEPFTLDLSGAWRFAPQVPKPFTGKAEQIDTWVDVQMPGHFALQGHEKLGRESGDAVAFLTTFDVPAAWAGRSIFLKCGSIDGYVRLWCNGKPVGTSDSAFLPVEFELTPYLKAGSANNIALTIEVSSLTGWYLRPMGGMGRKAELLALPSAHLSRMHAETHFEDDHARLTIDFTVKNDSPNVLDDAHVSAELLDQRGNPVELDHAWNFTLDPIPARGQDSRTMTGPLPNIQPWTPETPNLYTLRVKLDSPAGAMTTERSVGFRTIAIDGHRVLVNGQPLKLFGINYHVTHPGYGHFPPPGLIERDLRIFRDANVNALRAWPTPYRDLIDAANALGLWTTIEVPINLQLYAPGPRKDHGNDPSMALPYLHLAARVVETYRSDPSVLFWGLANESIYYPYFQRAGEAIRAADPNRPVFFGGDGRMGIDIPGTDLHDEHYPRDGVATVEAPGDIQPAEHALNHPDKPANFGWQFPLNKPAISSEWMHTHVNNRVQIDLDPGIDDFWGFVAEAHADWTRRTPNFVGGFQFLSAPYHEIGGDNQWRGLIDDDRRPTTLLWHLKKAYSPLALGDTRFDDDKRRVSFTLINRHNSLNLDQLDIRAGQNPEQLQTLAAQASPGESATLQLNYDPQAGPVHVVATSPRGFEIDRFVLTPPAPQTADPLDDPSIPGPRHLDAQHTDDARIIIRANRGTWTFEADTGSLLSAEIDGETVITAGPDFVLRGNGFPGEGQTIPPLGDLLTDWQTDAVKLHSDETRIVLHVNGHFPHAKGTYHYHFSRDGTMRLGYFFDWTWDTPKPIDVFEHGVAFDVADTFDTLSWKRDTQWSAYPDDHIGRPQGVAPAAGDPRFADAQTKPWSQDVHSDGTTRDFRSTKFFFRQASLTDGDGTGLQALAHGEAHIRARKQDDGSNQLLIDHFHNGGSEFHLIKSLRFQTMFLKAGDRIEGNATLRLTQP